MRDSLPLILFTTPKPEYRDLFGRFTAFRECLDHTRVALLTAWTCSFNIDPPNRYCAILSREANTSYCNGKLIYDIASMSAVHRNELLNSDTKFVVHPHQVVRTWRLLNGVVQKRAGMDNAESLSSPTVLPTAPTAAYADQALIRLEYCHSPIGILPVELTLAIMRHHCQTTWSRIKLTHVCQHWRKIMLNEASIWTYIEITPIFGWENSKTEGLFHILDMQLSRAASLPLDVVFFLNECQVKHDHFFEIFFKYEAFSRCRNLVLRMDYNRKYLNEANNILSFALENSTILDSLIVIYDPISHDIENIRDTFANRPPQLQSCTLDAVDIGGAPPVDREMLRRIYGIKLDQLSSLVLPNLIGRPAERPFLPENVTKIDCCMLIYHPFPDVQHYTLEICDFRKDSPPSLGSLVSLTTSSLIVNFGCKITLRSLKRLSCNRLELESGSAFSAPALQQLHIRGPRGSHEPLITYTERTGKALRSEGFGLIPSQILLLEDYFDAYTTMYLLRRCLHAQSISLTFKADTEALQVLECLAAGIGLKQGPVLGGVRKDEAYKSAFEIKMRIMHNQLDVIRYKSCAAEVVKKRNENGGDLKIYGKWEEDAEYILLA
ncbi:hypothetical protein M408DRAFT_27042 [Serendipita vermifera MAFF 305830]|uniref:Uncharacterized protein n=1 Tax=Serendipita vermifera MAFF 305830 TaxID=933852 RepID=A0A0C3AWL3_SERVB|nr:hypothetical protein M408DRAFT_27042 [Serendipita vermifera MAFF 305830]